MATDPKSLTRSLSAATNPALRMQELLRKQAGDQPVAPEQPPTADATPGSDTQISKEVSNDVSNLVSVEVSEELSNDVLASSSNDILEEVTPVTTKRSTKRVTQSRTVAPRASLAHSSVKERILGQAGKEPLVRLSVDVSETLHSRIKQYCAMHRVPSSRMLIIALLEEFLESEGY